MTTYLFPGQGSQAVGMGKTLFDEFPHHTHQADSLLGYSIKELCLEDKQQQLNHTLYTQPAIYVVNALTYFKQLKKSGKKPDYVAGHSLGEYNALLAAEVFDFETGLKLVKKRGELMSQATNGGMAAIVGFSAEEVDQILMQYDLIQVDIANFNSYSQIVISGSQEDINKAKYIFEKAGATLFITLNVSGAFHSSFMHAAQCSFATFLKQFKFSVPILPVISNITAKPYIASDIRYNLSWQISHPIRWAETIQYLLDQGETHFKEIGTGKMLTELIQRIRADQ